MGPGVLSLPPVAGLIAPSVVRTRPDLKDMGGYIVRVPRSLDIDMNEDSQRVWVQAPAAMVEEEGPVSFPTIVLSADELKLVAKCEEGFVDAENAVESADSGRDRDTVERSISRPENEFGQGPSRRSSSGCDDREGFERPCGELPRVCDAL